MARYLISFPDGAMTFPAEDLPEVSRSAHEVLEEAKSAGVYITGGGIDGHEVSVVGTDGKVAHTTQREHLGGFVVLDVPSRDEALQWAARFAAACRCAQEVRELMHDPDA